MNIEAAQTTLTRLCVAALSKNGATQDDIAACREAAAKMRGARSATHLVKQRRLSEADAEQIAAEEGLCLVREPRNASGFKGVSRNVWGPGLSYPGGESWIARLVIYCPSASTTNAGKNRLDQDGRRVHGEISIGSYPTAAEAALAYARTIGPERCATARPAFPGKLSGKSQKRRPGKVQVLGVPPRKVHCCRLCGEPKKGHVCRMPQVAVDGGAIVRDRRPRRTGARDPGELVDRDEVKAALEEDDIPGGADDDGAGIDGDLA